MADKDGVLLEDLYDKQALTLELLQTVIENQQRDHELVVQIPKVVDDIETIKLVQHEQGKDLKNLRADLDTVKTDLETVKTDIETVKTDLDTVKTDLETVKTDLDTVKTDLETVKTDLDTVKTDVKGVKATQHVDGKDLRHISHYLVEQGMPARA